MALIDRIERLREESEELRKRFDEFEEARSVFALAGMGIEVPEAAFARASANCAAAVGLSAPADNAEWAEKTFYAAETLVLYKGLRYICVTSHVSLENWYPGAVPALWAEHKEEFSEWKQPLGAHDAYRLGDKVSWMGKKWKSDMDINVWEPGVYGWTEV